MIDKVAKKVPAPGTGGAWEPPLVGTDGSVSFGIGNPYQSPAMGITNPGKRLYTDATVNLDAATGTLRWYYQGVTNDFYDWDMQLSPIAAEVNGAPAVIDAGKMGYVYAMDAKTGKLIWKTSVGEHNGHDMDSARALQHEFGPLKTPVEIEPGIYGGVETNMAVADDVVYAPQVVAYRLGATPPATTGSTTQTAPSTTAGAAGGAGAPGPTASGKAIFSANCASCHTLAAAGAGGTVGPDLDTLEPSTQVVATQVTNGGGAMPSFSGTLTDAEIQAVAKYVSSVAGKGGGGKTTTKGFAP